MRMFFFSLNPTIYVYVCEWDKLILMEMLSWAFKYELLNKWRHERENKNLIEIREDEEKTE